jgi:NADPH:quinone reductase-like Zn-dependent oxidoreductase
VRSFGFAPDVVAVESYEPGAPGPGQVRIRMLARAVNPSDHVTISGAYASRTGLPFVPGFEGVGIVEEVGPGVTECAPGEKVLPIGSAGAWQDVKIAEARWCFPAPSGLPDEQAAMSYVNPLTAWLMLTERGAPAPGMQVAVNAAGSAIGRMLLRMANRHGIRPVAVIRSPAARRLLEGLDLAGVIDTGAVPLSQALRHATAGRGLDLALDAVGGACGEALALAVRPGGNFIHYGLLSGRPLPADLPRRRADIRFELFWLRQWVHARSREVVGAHLAEVGRLVAEGLASSPVERRYELRDIEEALRHSLRAGRTGKIVVV